MNCPKCGSPAYIKGNTACFACRTSRGMVCRTVRMSRRPPANQNLNLKTMDSKQPETVAVGSGRLVRAEWPDGLAIALGGKWQHKGMGVDLILFAADFDEGTVELDESIGGGGFGWRGTAKALLEQFMPHPDAMEWRGPNSGSQTQPDPKL